jgi:hypothetical protein
MEIHNIELSSELKEILSEFDHALEKRKEFELGFNIFSLVSDTYYRENFHSEIISALLDPAGKHQEKTIFLELFLDFLINIGVGINKTDYLTSKASVINERSITGQRRIDILITAGNHAIIIENKIYNAIDMNNQLVDYYKYCITNDLNVDAILYLSLDGYKHPDRNKWSISDKKYFDEIQSKLETLSAFDIKRPERSIYSWLSKCAEHPRISDNSRFIIVQYTQLLKYLRGYIMETNTLEEYYEWISKNEEKLKDLEKWSNIHNNLTRYYPTKLKSLVDPINTNQQYYQYSKFYLDEVLIFAKIGDDEDHYLQVAFESNNYCEIKLMNVSRNWVYDEKFKANNQFLNLFQEGDNIWFFKQTEYNLIHDFNKLSDDIKESLVVVSEIIKNAKIT